MDYQLAQYIPWIPALAAVLCGLCCMKPAARVFAAPISIVAIFASFVLSVGAWMSLPEQAAILKLFTWIQVGSFQSDMAYYLDPLTAIMLLIITGIGTLVAWYAAYYMKGDKGYARFFAGVSLFIFAMTTLVMADNLVLLYLGWEGVGLCSYLLIGFYFDKPAAVEAAKKAFVVNRIGDLGFALGLMCIYVVFGSVQYDVILPAATSIFQSGSQQIQLLTPEVTAAIHQAAASPVWMLYAIPFLLMLGAFGKSAQLPLYMWLPDAMEGPTPVSALIHAATMVTAGVYLIARMLPIFQLSPYALPVVAGVGAATALFAAVIAMGQHDIKRIFAYSTISQLGYMFLAVGVLSSTGAIFHLFTHAFFKALLFLTAGSVMHAMAGQLDLRHMSGLRKKLPVTCWLMFLGCIALAGVPLTAGFFSKDLILAQTFDRGIHGDQPIFIVLGVVGLLTAFLTSYYTFRLWFRVFMGPEKYEMGHEHHGDAADAHHPAAPHEMPVMMNAPLVILAAGTILISVACLFFGFEHLLSEKIQASTANPLIQSIAQPSELAQESQGYSMHTIMMVVSSLIALGGIALAAWLHWLKREVADKMALRNPQLVGLLANKFYVDEACNAFIVAPLRFLGQLLFIIDQLVIHGLVLMVGFVPRLIGLRIVPAQNGVLQGYGLCMAAGIAALVALVLYLGL